MAKEIIKNLSDKKKEVMQYLVSLNEDKKRQETLQEYCRGGKVSKRKRIRSFASGGRLPKYQRQGEVTGGGFYEDWWKDPSMDYNPLTQNLITPNVGTQYFDPRLAGTDVGAYGYAPGQGSNQTPAPENKGGFFNNLFSGWDDDRQRNALNMALMAGTYGKLNTNEEAYKYKPATVPYTPYNILHDLKPRTQPFKDAAADQFRLAGKFTKSGASPAQYQSGMQGHYANYLRNLSDIEGRRWDQESMNAERKANMLAGLHGANAQARWAAQDYSQQAVDAKRSIDMQNALNFYNMGHQGIQDWGLADRNRRLLDIYEKTYGPIYNLPTSFENSSGNKRTFT